MRSIPLTCVFSVLCAAGAQAAGPLPVTQRGYEPADSAGCKIWAPSTLGTNDYIPHYSGPCHKGYAEGTGKLEWAYRYSEGKTKATWNGTFRNGVFVGDQAIKGPVTPMGGDRYWVPMGKVSGGELHVVATSPQDGPLDLCYIDSVGVQVNSSVAQDNDDAVKQLLTSIADHYATDICTKPLRGMRVEAFNVPVQVGDNGRLPDPFADARMNLGTPGVTSYSNKVAEAARQKTRQAAAQQQQDAARKQFDDFSTHNHITSWVTTEQLDTNPFKYEGQTVGVIVRMVRMLTRDSAVVQGALADSSTEVLLQNINPDFPGHEQSVLIAVKVGKRAPLPDTNATYTAISKLDTRTCTRSDCMDWLMWLRGNKDFNWGEPFKPQK